MYSSLKEEILIKVSTLDIIKNNQCFNVEYYLKTKGSVLMGEADKSISKPVVEKVRPSKDIENDDLFGILKEWRLNKSQEQDRKAFQILHNSTLIAIANTCPLTYAELANIKGMGQMKLKEYSEELLDIISEYYRSCS